MMANYGVFNNASTLPALASMNQTANPSTLYSTTTGSNATGGFAPYTGMATKTAQASIAALTLLCVVFATL